MMKKSIQYLIASLALLAAGKASAWDFTSGGIYYHILNDEEVAITRATTETGQSLYDNPVLIVPQQVYFDGLTYRVAAIDDHAFVGSALTEVQLPLSVTSIGLGAFEGVSSLTSITLPLYLDVVSPYMLSGTGITAIAIPDGVTRLGQGAFEGCTQLHTVYLPASMSSIGDFAFDNCFNLFEIYCAAEMPPSIDTKTNFLSMSGIDVIVTDERIAKAYDEDSAWGNHDLFSLWSNDDINITAELNTQDYADTWRRMTLGDNIAYKVYDFDGRLIAMTAANAYYAALTGTTQDVVLVATNLMTDSEGVLAMDTYGDTSPEETPEPATVEMVENLEEREIIAQGGAIYIGRYREGDWTTVYDSYGRLYYQHPTIDGYIDGLPTGHIYIVVVGDTVKKVAL